MPQRRSLLLLAGTAIGLPMPALAQERFYADASLSAGIANNPFLEAGDTPLAASATVEISPVYMVESPLTTLRIVGDARVTVYDKRYRTNDSYAINGIGEHQLSEQVTLGGQIGYVNSFAGSIGDIQVPVVDVGLISQLPPLTDATLSGLGRRRSSYQGLASVTARLSPFDRVSARFTTAATRYAGRLGLDEYNTVGGGASYRRRLSESLELSGNLDVGRIDYLGGGLGDATIIQPGLSITRTWGPGWSLSASGSAAIVRLQETTGTRTSSSVNGSATICRRDIRWNACLSAWRMTLPSSVLGVRTQAGVSANLGMRITEVDTLSLTGSYSRASTPLLRTVATPAGSGSVSVLSAGGDYAHRFAEHLSGFVSGALSKSYSDVLKRGANMEGRLGIRYRFGEGR